MLNLPQVSLAKGNQMLTAIFALILNGWIDFKCHFRCYISKKHVIFHLTGFSSSYKQFILLFIVFILSYIFNNFDDLYLCNYFTKFNYNDSCSFWGNLETTGKSFFVKLSADFLRIRKFITRFGPYSYQSGNRILLGSNHFREKPKLHFVRNDLNRIWPAYIYLFICNLRPLVLFSGLQTMVFDRHYCPSKNSFSYKKK